ncbi:MAG: hypothetical protein DMF56_05945 [Acidobacteria bacterium]|nr:MAG: hypothetical protein DMF56_05945 [Acidobacteriota bacterium]
MNVEHERALAVRELTGVAIDVPWRAYNLFAQAVFFVLTGIGVYTLYKAAGDHGIITGIAALALAEYLIRRQRWFRTGVESALWIGALFAFISELPNSGKPEAMLVLGAAAAIAGARVRNPLFGALAAGFAMHYFERKWDLGVLFALVVATIAIVLLSRTWRRPSTEWLFIAIALTLPIAGYAEADAAWRWTTIALYAAFGCIAVAFAIARRHHAFFLASAIGFAIASIEIGRELSMLVLEAKLAIGGAFLLTMSIVVSRLLRDRTRGFVATREKLTTADDVLAIAATIAMQPAHHTSNVTTSREDGGGEFGGAGASGDY